MLGPRSAADSDAVGAVIDSFQSGLSWRATQAVLITIIVQLVAGVAMLLGFMILRPRNKILFMPRYKYSADDKRPPKLSNGPFGWLPPIMRLREPEMLDKVGLDAVVYLRFLRMARYICLVVTLGAVGVLLPINYIYNTTKVTKEQGFLTKITISNLSGNILYAHVGFTYFVCLVTYVFIYFNYRQVVNLRWKWFQSPSYQTHLYARSIMITHVNSRFRSDPGLQTLLDKTGVPYQTTSVHIGRRVGGLPYLVDQHNDTIKKLEQVLTTYFRKGEKHLDKRPTMRVGGMFGRKVDSIDYLTDKIKQLELKITALRENIADRKAENYGFASFGTVAWAHMVGKKLASRSVKGAKFELAPPPSDIIWENIARSDTSRYLRNIFGTILLVVLMAIFVIPVTAAALVANLTALTRYVGFLETWSEKSHWTFSAVLGIAPVAINAVAQVLIAATIRWLAKYMTAPTEMKMDRAVLARYFAFIFITQFIIFNVLGVVAQTAEKIVFAIGDHKGAAAVWDEFKKIPGELQGTYVSMSNYWIGWLAAKGSGVILDLLQIPMFFSSWLRSKIFGRTPRAIREWTKPREFDYPINIANMMLLLLVAFVYAPLAPFVPMFAMVAFFLGSWVYKYQLLYACDTRCESGGRMARMIINRILFCLIIMSLFMVLTAGLQLGWVYSATAAPPIVTTILFKLLLKLRFDSRFSWYIPDQVEMEQAHVHSSDAQKDRLLRRFGHPSLHDELFTPMLHEKHQHLLSRVYTGVTSEKEPFEDHMVDGAVAGGLMFTGIGQDDLEYSRMQYLRERDADTMSISTASVFSRNRGISVGDESKLSSPYSDRRSSYLAGAPSPPLVDGMALPYSPASFGERASSYMGVLPYGSQEGGLSPPQRPSQIKWASEAPSSIAEQEEGYPPPSMPAPPPHRQSHSPDRFSGELGPYSSEVVVPHSLVPGGGDGGGGFATPAEHPLHHDEFDGYSTPLGRGGHDSFDDPRPPGAFGFPQSPELPPRHMGPYHDGY